ncbi:hypothetical protein DB347_21720 [Opitutaceae bacterium EW11]|nr:hypothetical protein DB347_21720 [Opitutaceae bacterium EW11]
MTFRLRFHLAILPLFLGFTAAALGLHYALHRRELDWGLAQQSEGRAVTLASFLAQSPGNGLPPGPESWTAQANRLARSAGGLAVTWFEREGSGWRTRQVVTDPSLHSPALPDAGILAQLETGAPAWRHVPLPNGEFDESQAYALVLDTDRSARAVLGVTERDRVTRAELHWVLRTGAWALAAAFVASLIVAELLTAIARRDLAAISEGARALARGAAGHSWKPSVVSEFADLSRTLQSIDRILLEGGQQTLRRFFRAEQLPSEDETAVAFEEACAAAPLTAADAPACVVRRLGHGHDDFSLVQKTAAGWALGTARLQPPPDTESALDRSVRAAAARDLLSGLLASHSPEEAWQRLAAVYPLARGCLVILTPTGEAPVCHTFGPDGAGVVQPQPGAQYGIVSTLAPASLQTAREFAQYSFNWPLDRAADELVALLAERDRGLLLLFHPFKAP